MLREDIAFLPEDVAGRGGAVGDEAVTVTSLAPPPQSSGGIGMRVAVVAETFLPGVDGVVDAVLRLVDHLAVRGHDPVVVAPSGTGYESRCGAWVDVATVPSMRLPGYRQLSVARPSGDLTEVLGELAPDVVHLASPAVLGLAAARAARALGTPSVAVFQTGLAADAEHHRLPGGPAAAWRYLHSVREIADLTLAPSTTTLAMLARHGIGPVSLWPRGVDLDQFAPWHRSPELRRELAPNGELLVGVVARLAVERRLELLAPLSELPGVRLVVVGDGPQRRQLSRRMPRAQFLGQLGGAELGGAELGAVVASLDLFVNPGADETSCRAVQEALAAGVPAVVTASGGPPDLVRHRQNGWLWAGDDPHLLAAMVAGLRDDPAGLHAAAVQARPSVAERTWGRIGDELIGHLQQVRARVRPR